jgi:hypothetical protein
MLRGASALSLAMSLALLSSPSMSKTATPSDPLAANTANDRGIWLEDLEGKPVMDWVKAHNAATEKRLEGDPRYQSFYDKALAIYGAKDRIPAPQFVNGQVYNFWEDEQHLRGIWRRTTLADYRSASPQWETVLDIDALGKAEGKSWVYQGADCLEPAQRFCLISLSDGGEDAAEVREFDLEARAFVPGGFHIPRAKQAIAWEDADHLLVATEWTAGDMTTSLYPYILKRVTRGRPLSEAVEIYRGQKSDLGVIPAVLHDGQGHSFTYVSRAIDFFHQQTLVMGADGKLHELAMPQKVTVAGLVAGQVVFRLDEAWGDLPAGSVATAPLAAVMARSDAVTPRLAWKPTAREALDGVSMTRDRLLLSVLDNVNGRLLSLAPTADGGWTTPTFWVGGVRAFAAFWLGVCIHRALRDGLTLSRAWQAAILVIAAAVTAYVTLVHHTWWWADFACAVVGFPAIIVGAALSRHWLLENRLGDLVGEASFSVYLLHGLTIDGLSIGLKALPHLHPTVHLGLGAAWMAALVAGSWICWRWVETPLRVRFSRPRAAPAPVPDAVAA